MMVGSGAIAEQPQLVHLALAGERVDEFVEVEHLGQAVRGLSLRYAPSSNSMHRQVWASAMSMRICSPPRA